MELNKKNPIQTLHVWRFPYSELIMYRGGQMENVKFGIIMKTEIGRIFVFILYENPGLTSS